MHPLKDQREGVKYGRGVKYGVTPGLDEDLKTDKPKEKKNKGPGKSKGKKSKTVPSATVTAELLVLEKPQTGSLNITAPLKPTRMDMPSLGVFMSLDQSSTTTSTKTSYSTLQPIVSSGVTGTGPDITTAQDFSDVDSLTGRSDKDSEDGQISDSETQEQNEEMNYWETVRAVRAFFCWSYIPDFECSVGDVDPSDNPWKGKHPCKTGKVSVELPADDCCSSTFGSAIT